MKFKEIFALLPEQEREVANKKFKNLMNLVYAFMGVSFFALIGMGILSYLEGCK